MGTRSQTVPLAHVSLSAMWLGYHWTVSLSFGTETGENTFSDCSPCTCFHVSNVAQLPLDCVSLAFGTETVRTRSQTVPLERVPCLQSGLVTT